MLVLLLLLQNMGIEYDEAMETIHVIKRDGSVSSISPHRDNFEASANRIMPAALQLCTATGAVGMQPCAVEKAASSCNSKSCLRSGT